MNEFIQDSCVNKTIYRKRFTMYNILRLKYLIACVYYRNHKLFREGFVFSLYINIFMTFDGVFRKAS